MKCMPILFSPPMVRAILAGRKTQTRRILKPQHIPAGVRTLRFENQNAEELMHVAKCPYGSPGDRLWVRETWGEVSHVDWGDPRKEPFVHVLGPDERCIIYREEALRHGFEWAGESEAERWRPSIHMPRWASRLALAITDVRVQRVQEISEEDACWEGAMGPFPTFSHGEIGEGGPDSHRDGFADLWNSINGPDAWQRNDWVWALTFEVLK